jgi:hypothetical protein
MGHRFLSRRLAQFRDGKVQRVRRVLLKRLMRSSAIVETEVAAKRGIEFSGCFISMQIDLLVLDAAPQPLDEHVVDPAPVAVHANCDAVDLERVGERLGGELAALDALLFVK